MKQKPLEKNLKIYCDKCRFKFKLKPKNIHTESVTEKVERSYFKCPKCREKYIISYSDDEMKENISRMKELQLEIEKDKFEPNELEALRIKLTNLHQRNIDIDNKYKVIFKKS